MTDVAVRVNLSDADFYLLPEEDSRSSAQALVEELTQLRSAGGQLRLRPRTAPSEHDEEDLTGHEDPGTSWRDVLGESVGSVEVVEYEPTMALWHWAIEPHGAADFEVG